MEPKGLPVLGIITGDLNLVPIVLERISEQFGQVLTKSPVIDFNFTNYYEKELGRNLSRLWTSHTKYWRLSEIAALKTGTNQLEKEFFTTGGLRRINLDPGIITLVNLILLTTKNYSHRIYLKDGIYAEVTLLFRNKSFEPLAWTYPDYRTETAINFFNEVRKRLLIKQNT